MYWLSLLLFLLQGISQSLSDTCCGESSIRLWNGISDSPITLIQAGYGIGALLIVLISKPYVKFNPLTLSQSVSSSQNNSSFNMTISNKNAVSSDIKLQIPYSIAAIIGGCVGLAFVFTYFYELKMVTRYSQAKTNVLQDENEDDKKHNVSETNNQRLYKLVFGNIDNKNGETFSAKCIQMILIILLSMLVGAHAIVLGSFMLTYVTTGPAKISLNSYFTLYILFWLFVTISRLITTIVAFRISTLKVYAVIILFNILCSILYILPVLNKNQLFYWFIIPMLALASGPVIPSTLMFAKYLLVNINSAIVALIAFGFASGAIASSYLTGFLLDNFKPNPNWFGYDNSTSIYIIPLIIFISILICFVLFLLLVFANRHFKPRILKDPHIW